MCPSTTHCLRSSHLAHNLSLDHLHLKRIIYHGQWSSHSLTRHPNLHFPFERIPRPIPTRRQLLFLRGHRVLRKLKSTQMLDIYRSLHAIQNQERRTYRPEFLLSGLPNFKSLKITVMRILHQHSRLTPRLSKSCPLTAQIPSTSL